jgi:hypothetical protein
MHTKTIIWVWLISMSFTAPRHALHLSKTIIEWSADKKELQVSVHLFIDDLEKSLGKQGFKKLGIGTEKESAQAQAAIIGYLNKEFKLWVDDKIVATSFVGKETANDMQGLYCYLVVPKVNRLKKLSIQNSILLDLYEDQQNMIEFKAPGGVVKYEILESRRRICMFSL